METHAHTFPLDSVDIARKRLEILLGAKLRLKDKMIKAAKIQDKLRKKSEKWKGSAVVREWRDKRYKF